MSLPKIFQVGFNKCGTRSLTEFFRRSGYRAAHWKGGKLADDIMSSKAAGRVPLQNWSGTVLFTDLEKVTKTEMVEAYREFAYLDETYPDAHFLLNTRNVDDWLTSRMRHWNGTYFRDYMKHYNTRDPIAVLQQWKDDWFSHIDAVRTYFADRPGKLIEFDLDRDDAQALTLRFDGILNLNPKKWGHHGRTRVTSLFGT
ncbi:MAG: sulfotransferase [Pseudomonadota bacterium]